MRVNPFVFTCITPHGGEIIPELQGELPTRMEVTRNSMLRLGNEMSQANPDCLIVLTPHGTKIDGQFSITNSENVVGVVEENGVAFELERHIDREIASAIYQQAKKKEIPVGLINFGTSGGPYSCLPLDWGAIVPLRFMPHIPIVVITPSRDISFDMHIELGKALRNVAQQTNKKIGLIVSCDWSHTHDENGPYGFNPAAKQLDEEVVRLIKGNNLEDMADFDPEYIEAAKPDGIWQTMILSGAIPFEERKVQFYSYEAPTYFGLICAAYYQ